MNTTIMNRDQEFFNLRRAGNTAREIVQQPRTWRKLADYLEDRRDDISAFMDEVMALSDLRTIFSGAGSSAFIGESMQMLLAGELGLRCEAIHTTDIVATPINTLLNVPTLLVSYSRSGESPESVGALQYAAARIDRLYNIVLVCRENSSVARQAASVPGTLVLHMPPETCDVGFAMTSSVSCMALATWCVFGYQNMDERISQIRRLADIAESRIDELDVAAQSAAALEFNRLVFLGSGALRGLAREAAVKMLELTAGEVNSGWDTPTGFRHGPKSVINDSTLTVHLMSNLPFTRRYDDSFLCEVIGQRRSNKVIAVATGFEGIPGSDLEVPYPKTDEISGEIYSYIMGLLFVQMLAVEKSILLGNNTDDPSDGKVNRVVKGIEIYPLV